MIVLLRQDRIITSELPRLAALNVDFLYWRSTLGYRIPHFNLHIR
jgi:hypothetical protein